MGIRIPRTRLSSEVYSYTKSYGVLSDNYGGSTRGLRGHLELNGYFIDD